MINAMLRCPELVKGIESEKFYQVISSMDSGSSLSVVGFSGNSCNLHRLSNFNYELRVYGTSEEPDEIIVADYTDYDSMMGICDNMVEVKFN